MADDNWLVALDGVGLIDKTPIRQGLRKRSWVGSDIRPKQMKLALDRRTDRLACQARQLPICQGIHCHGFVQRRILSPKMRIQTQFHYAPGCGVAAERIHQIHQRVGSFTVVKVLVHFVLELLQLFAFHKLRLYAVPLFLQTLSKVQYSNIG